MKNLLFFSFGIFISGFIHSQEFKPESISNGGGLLWNSNVKMTYTIGETVAGTISNATTLLTQGFQQTWSVIPVSVSKLPDDNFKINVYPNPSKDLINISLQKGNLESTIIELFDLNGKVLLKQIVTDKSTEKQISLSNYPECIYSLKITTISGKKIGTYKIQKIN
jgi:hypothetical protein